MQQLGIGVPVHEPHGASLTADTLASEVQGLEHSMRQMERSDAEIAAMLAHPHTHGLDDDDVHELQLALAENVGVMQRKRALLARLSQALEDALQLDRPVADPAHRHADPLAPPPAPASAPAPAPAPPLYAATAEARAHPRGAGGQRGSQDGGNDDTHAAMRQTPDRDEDAERDGLYL